jgi:hypothetical protein
MRLDGPDSKKVEDWRGQRGGGSMVRVAVGGGLYGGQPAPAPTPQPRQSLPGQAGMPL